MLAFKVLILQRPTPAVRNGHTFTVNAPNDTAATPIAFATAGRRPKLLTHRERAAAGVRVHGNNMPQIRTRGRGYASSGCFPRISVLWKQRTSGRLCGTSPRIGFRSPVIKLWARAKKDDLPLKWHSAPLSRGCSPSSTLAPTFSHTALACSSAQGLF